MKEAEVQKKLDQSCGIERVDQQEPSWSEQIIQTFTTLVRQAERMNRVISERGSDGTEDELTEAVSMIRHVQGSLTSHASNCSPLHTVEEATEFHPQDWNAGMNSSMEGTSVTNRSNQLDQALDSIQREAEVHRREVSAETELNTDMLNDQMIRRSREVKFMASADEVKRKLKVLIDVTEGCSKERNEKLKTSLHAKLLSKNLDRKKLSPQEMDERHRKKHWLAEENRRKLEKQKRDRLKEKQKANHSVLERNKEKKLLKLQTIEKKLKKAESLKSEQIETIVNKARNESLKVKEIHFINECKEKEKGYQCKDRLNSSERRRNKHLESIKNKASKLNSLKKAALVTRPPVQPTEQQTVNTLQHPPAKKKRGSRSKRRRKKESLLSSLGSVAMEKSTQMSETDEIEHLLSQINNNKVKVISHPRASPAGKICLFDEKVASMVTSARFDQHAEVSGVLSVESATHHAVFDLINRANQIRSQLNQEKRGEETPLMRKLVKQLVLLSPGSPTRFSGFCATFKRFCQKQPSAGNVNAFCSLSNLMRLYDYGQRTPVPEQSAAVVNLLHCCSCMSTEVPLRLILSKIFFDLLLKLKQVLQSELGRGEEEEVCVSDKHERHVLFDTVIVLLEIEALTLRTLITSKSLKLLKEPVGNFVLQDEALTLLAKYFEELSNGKTILLCSLRGIATALPSTEAATSDSSKHRSSDHTVVVFNSFRFVLKGMQLVHWLLFLVVAKEFTALHPAVSKLMKKTGLLSIISILVSVLLSIRTHDSRAGKGMTHGIVHEILLHGLKIVNLLYQVNPILCKQLLSTTSLSFQFHQLLKDVFRLVAVDGNYPALPKQPFNVYTDLRKKGLKTATLAKRRQEQLFVEVVILIGNYMLCIPSMEAPKVQEEIALHFIQQARSLHRTYVDTVSGNVIVFPALCLCLLYCDHGFDRVETRIEEQVCVFLRTIDRELEKLLLQKETRLFCENFSNRFPPELLGKAKTLLIPGQSSS